MSTAPGQTQFNVTLPDQAIETMMALKKCGLYGTNRAEIARTLILDMLKEPRVQELIRARIQTP
jgi:hypothetical protein